MKRSSAGAPSRPSASYLFTGRSQERELLRTFFANLTSAGSRPAEAILNPYGVSGVGKTALLQVAISECRRGDLSPHIVLVDLDSDRWTPTSAINQFFWNLRCQMRFSTPIFDYLYFLLWRAEHPGQKFVLDDSAVRTLLQNSGDIGSVLSTASETFHGGGAIGGTFHLLDQAAVWLRDQSRRARLTDRLKVIPEELTQKETERMLPRALDLDISDYLAAGRVSSLVIIFDGFERVQSSAPADDIQRAVALLCGYMAEPETTHFGRAGVLLVGRERLRWEDLYGDEWRGLIHSRRMIGLSEYEAREFLGKAARFHKDATHSAIEAVLRDNEDALLEATGEHCSDHDECSYNPYFLDLAYDLARRRGEEFRPEDLGRCTVELQIRFLRYFQVQHPNVMRAFQCLALSGLFNKGIYYHLVQAGHIPAGLPFASLVGGDYSFVDEVRDSPGDYRFHALMELALLRSQTTKPEDILTARDCIECVVSYLVCQARFIQMSECNTQHMSAYHHAMSVAFQRYYNGLLDVGRLFQIAFQLEAPFESDVSFASQRAPLFQELLRTYLDREGCDVDVMCQLANKTGLLVAASGDLEDAENLFRPLLDLSERTLGFNDSRTLSLASNLAPILQMRGKMEEAEALYRRVLQILEDREEAEGGQIQHLAGCLAALLSKRGDYNAAKQLGEQALAIAERIYGPKALETLLAANNLAVTLNEMDELNECEALSHRTLSAGETTLGQDHEFTLVSLDNLALAAQKRGDLVAAESLYRRALEGSERTFGREKRQTLIRVNNLAYLLRAKGDRSGAETLQRAALEGLAQELGPEHPDVLNCMTNLCTCLLESGPVTGDLKSFCNDALATITRVLGEEHPITLRATNNVGLLCEAEANFPDALVHYRKAVSGLHKIGVHSSTVIVQGNIERIEKKIRSSSNQPSN